MVGHDWALLIAGLVGGSLCFVLGYFTAKSYWYSRGHLDGTEDAARYVQTRNRVKNVEQRRHWEHHEQQTG